MATDARTEADTEGSTESLTLVQAVRDGLETEMERDDDVVVMGEDVGENGGVFRATEGLYEQFGGDRVIDTPLAESGIVGTAVGMAAYGMRPVAEMQFLGFIYPGFDQIVSHAARLRTRSRGRYTCPLVVRAPYGGGIRAPEHHSESSEAMFVHQPGLKVVVPSTPSDTKGLLTSAIRSPDPVLFLEPKLIYRAFREDVPSGSYEVPLGEAAVRREGSDISVFTWGAMTRPTIEAADELEGEIDVEVVDLRTLSPLDEETIVESFEKTGRAAVVHEAPKTGGLAAEITTTLQEQALLYQEAPVERITGFDTPFPLYALEDYYLPEAARIETGIREAMGF
ncbi:alpha-ketoacid dehydrogenase subunit beta [Natronobacterium gregoryi]|uniref:Alpha-ketoacid dehydrogenase subunit beta n=2 Tax=Natronobacterium gregoryi TaxID=44930 RepID=L0AF71_NATGS|nr:alpha-ketoacid dehydrogenase subunit beta [Natronobacterium gregoryi]AFZ72563.1 pyruvate/2-oxoglutarate dehydrogenase complex, dehydrogenase component beta subunit [Natronobacterium gregoryi SP2]ELY71918.1 transketolase [Natronobacterium gregoryi SP2]PLK19355.1 alpha-ketoacid dehydrogenase subunit beta [Natronobacterium gregoryi SP2]SFJ52148.1 pyruvate dehydrogenase E1 component beta subunit [Natronobacterium gregoryi]